MDDDHGIEVWNRATAGVPHSELPGDVALAHALRFDGYAEGDGVLAAIESEVGEGLVGTGAAGFAWFGMDDVAAVIREGATVYRAELVLTDLEGEAHAARWDEVEAQVDARYAELDASARLSAALATALTERAGAFAPPSSAPGHPTEAPEVLRERAPYALDVSGEEKVRRTVEALNAFGLRAEVEDGRVVLHPHAAQEEQLVDAILGLIDERYPDA